MNKEIKISIYETMLIKSIKDWFDLESEIIIDDYKTIILFKDDYKIEIDYKKIPSLDEMDKLISNKILKSNLEYKIRKSDGHNYRIVILHALLDLIPKKIEFSIGTLWKYKNNNFFEITINFQKKPLIYKFDEKININSHLKKFIIQKRPEIFI